MGMLRLRRFWTNFWPLLILYILILLFFWRTLTPDIADRMRFAEGDFSYIFYPARYYVAESLWQGNLPVWNPHVANGYPHCADPQAACFYPISLGTALLSGGHLTVDMLQGEAIFHFALAATFTYLFVLYLLGSRKAAFVSALAFTFSGYLTSFPSLQLSELEAIVWMPLALWMCTLAVDRGKARYLAVGGLALAMTFLAGRPQAYVSILPLTLAWMIYRARQRQFSWARIGGYIALLGGVAVALAAVQILPTLELTRLSSRADVSYVAASEGGFAYWELGGIFSPRALGSQPLYVGLAALALAALSVTRRKGWFWAAAGFVGLLFSLGDGTILFDAAYVLQRILSPGIIRNMERTIVVFAFSTAMLAGYGMSALEKGEWDARIARGIKWALAGLALLALPLYVLRISAAQPEPFVRSLDAAVFGILFLAAAWVLLRQASAQNWARWALAGLLALDLLTTNAGYILQPYAQDPLAEVETARQVAAIPGIFRTQADGLKNGDYGNLIGVENVDSDAPLQLQYYLRLLQVDELRRLQILNVHVVATRREMTHGAFKLLYEQDGVRFYLFFDQNPRAYLVEYVRVASDDEDAAQILEAADFRPAAEAVVQGDAPNIVSAPIGSGESAEILSRAPTRIEIQVQVDSPRLLVYADTFYPGWQATIDGAPAPILRTNLALRGIVVPAGQHHVILFYRPTTLYVGAGISLATLLAVAVFLVVCTLRRRKESQ
jgi:hypothetical protein